MGGLEEEPSGGSVGPEGSAEPLPSGAEGKWVPVVAAAARLGISDRAVRLRIQAGRLEARRQGPRWLVWLPAGESGSGAEAAGGRLPEGLEAPEASGRSGEGGQSAAPAGGGSVAELIGALRSEQELLREERERSSRLETERAQLYGQVGYLQAELASAQEQLRLLAPPRAEPIGEEEEPPAAPMRPVRRRWWQVWR